MVVREKTFIFDMRKDNPMDKKRKKTFCIRRTILCLLMLFIGWMMPAEGSATNTAGQAGRTTDLEEYDFGRYAETDGVAYAKLPRLLLRMASKSRHVAGSEIPASLLKSLDYVVVVAAEEEKGKTMLSADALKVSGAQCYEFFTEYRDETQTIRGYYNENGDVIEELILFIEYNGQQLAVQFVGNLSSEEMLKLLQVFQSKNAETP